MAERYDPDGVGVENGNFFGLPFTPEQARLVLMPVPWDVTVSYGGGAADAPEALLAASTQLDLYDEHFPDAWRRGIATLPVDSAIREESMRLRADARKVIRYLEQGFDPASEAALRRTERINRGSERLNRTVYERTRRLLEAGKRVGLIGGDHSTPYGAIRATAEYEERIGVLHLDAHCDLRERYEGFDHSHASVMFNVLRDVPQVERIVQVGVRDYCYAEAALAAASPRVELYSAAALAAARFEGETWRVQCDRIVERLPRKVYVSFDIDVLEMGLCPNTGTPVPGGLRFDEAVYLLRRVADSGRRVVGFDLVEAVGGAQARTDAIVGARILYKLCGLTLKTEE